MGGFRSVLTLGCVAAAYASACGSSGGGGQPNSNTPDASSGGDEASAGSGAGGGSGSGQADSASPVFTSDSGGPLSARILPVRCNGACADVRADVQGGNPPYNVQWDDGTTNVDREVCSVPDGGSIRLKVTDTAGTNQEVPVPAQTATDQVAGGELDCTPPEDAGAGCQVLLSSTLFVGSDAEPYSACDDAGQSLTFGLAEPLRAGQSYTVAIDFVFPVLLGNQPSLEIYGASKQCEASEKLGTLTFNGSPHVAFCTQPAADYSSLTIRAEVPDGSIFILALALQETATICGGCSNDP